MKRKLLTASLAAFSVVALFGCQQPQQQASVQPETKTSTATLEIMPPAQTEQTSSASLEIKPSQEANSASVEIKPAVQK